MSEHKSLEEFMTDVVAQRLAKIAANRMLAEQGKSPAESAEIPALSSLVSQVTRAVTFEQSDVSEASAAVSAAGPRRQSSIIDHEIAVDSIETLLEKLEPKSPTPAPLKQLVKGGVFFPCHLLYPGWWTRSPHVAGLASGEWKGSEKGIRNIRHWLNFGFEQWGPSWNVWNPEEKQQCLFGQIGVGDEANSIPVIVAPNAAARIRADMEDKLAVGVVAKGTLYHDHHKWAGLHVNVRMALERATAGDNKAMSYYLVINDFEADGSKSDDFVEICYDQPEIYSAYMWHCLVRGSDAFLGRRGTITLPGTIFVWEHTNLMSRDCIAYNYESLHLKREYLQRLLQLNDKLLLLQHSYSVRSMLREEHDEPLIGPRGVAKILRATHDALCSSEDNMQSAIVVPFSKSISTTSNGAR